MSGASILPRKFEGSSDLATWLREYDACCDANDILKYFTMLKTPWHIVTETNIGLVWLLYFYKQHCVHVALKHGSHFLPRIDEFFLLSESQTKVWNSF